MPLIVVSPYARAGYVSHTQYEFGSILKFVELNWNLGSLHTTDDRANDLFDTFNFQQRPRPFVAVPVPATMSIEHFLNEKPSNLPVDDD